MPTVKAIATGEGCLGCAKMLGVNKIGRSNNFKRVDLKGIDVPLQGAVQKKVDVTTNEWRFAQETISR
jgi:hypothetical protein